MSKDEFEFDIDKSKVTKMLKKAKRKQLVKVIIVSMISSVLVFILLLSGLNSLNNYAFEQMSIDLAMMRNITRPNTEQSNAIINDGLFKSTVVYNTYKVIEGQPVKWESETYQFKVWNTYRKLDPSNPLRIQEESEASSSPIYNEQTLEREMQFYLPFVSYPQYINDLPLLSKLDNQVAEVAISFDKPYPVSKIKEMLPNGVRPVWYWVDTYSSKQFYRSDSLPESARYVYGFRAKPGMIEHGDGTEKDFLLAIKNGMEAKGKYYSEYKRIYDYQRGEKEKPNEKDVRIFGVVVTGTSQDLQKLNKAPYMKAAVLGATVNRES